MNHRAIRMLNLRGLRARPLRTALAILAVGSATAIVVGVLIAQHSLNRALRDFSQAVSGPATLRIEGPVDHGGLDQSVLARVAAVDGVEDAVPMVLAITQAVDRDGDVVLIPVLGIDCAIEAIAGGFGCTPELLTALDRGPALGPALQRRLGPGSSIRTDLRVLPTEGAPVVPELATINGGRVAVFELSTAQVEFARPGGLDAIFVVPEPGAAGPRLRAALEAAVGAHNKVLDSASAPGDALFIAQLILPFMFLISLVALLMGAQLVRNAMELSLEERRRELATSAALGRSPRELVIGALTEAAVVGAVGGAVGIVLGGLVARAFVAALSDQLTRATGLQFDAAITGIAVVAGLGVGVVVCVLASVAAARRASRRELAAELSERARFDPERGRARAWAVVLPSLTLVAVGCGWVARRDGALELWQPPVLVVGMVLSLLLTFQLNWMLVGIVLRRLRGRPGFRTGAARVALDSLLSMPRRTSGLASAIAAPALMAVVLSSIAPGIAEGAERLATQDTSGRVYVSTLATNNSGQIDAKVTPALERRLAALPHVERIDHSYFGIVDHPSFGVTELAAYDGEVPRYRVHRGEDGATVLAEGEVMVGPRLARDQELQVGDTITVPGRYGFVDLRVGGIWASPSGVGRSVAMTAEVLETITGPRPPDRLHVVPTAGTTPEALADEIRAAGIDDRLIVLDPDELAADYGDEFTAIASPFWTMQRGILLVAVVATGSTLLLVAIQRRRESALLAALGMAPGSLTGSTFIETLLLGGAATVVAACSSQLAVLTFTWSSEVLTGLAIPYRPAVGGLLVAALSAVAVALVGAAIPAWRVGRADPITALREA